MITPHDPLVPRVLFVTRDTLNATALYRCIWPARHLALRGYVADVASFETFDDRVEALEHGRYNLIVTNALASDRPEGVDKMLESFKRWGLTVVYDADDDYFTSESAERMERLMPRSYPHEAIRESRVHFIRRADAITVSREPLAKVARWYSERPGYVIENAIDVAAFRSAHRHGALRMIPRNRTTVGWSGGSREAEDLAVVATAWSRIARRYPKVQFVVQGVTAGNPLVDAVPRKRLLRLPWVDLGEYPSMLLNIDIGCCAVADTINGRCKSPNKWVEFALAGVPCVVSETVYGEYVKDGEDAIVARDADAWEAAIAALIEDPARCVRTATLAGVAAEARFDLAHRWEDWARAYAAILMDAGVRA